MRVHSATIVAPTQKDQPLFSLKRRPRFQVHKEYFGTNADLIMDPDGPETKYVCAGEEQPQLTGPGPGGCTCTDSNVVKQKNVTYDSCGARNKE
jgi:hypothetical protein